MGRVRSRRSVAGIFIFVSLLFAHVMQAGADPVPCSRYASGDAAPSPYGLAWNWFSSEKELILSAACEGTVTTVSIGKANANLPANNQGLVFAWSKAYAYDGTSWNVDKPIPLTCNGTKVAVADVTPADSLPDYWCNGTLTGTLPSNAAFFAAYTCGFTGTTWQCGCTDASCTKSFWQLQGVQSNTEEFNLGWALSGNYEDRRITLRFGDDWVSSCGSLIKKHTGTDFSADKEEPVFAAQDGTVRVAQTDSVWGGWLTIEHNGYTTVYWHVIPEVSPDNYREKGERIGVIADLGSNTHFHFGLRNAPYSNIANRGSLPQTVCDGDPAFPENFINPETLRFD